MANAWLAHVKDTMKKHKGMQFKDVLKAAKKTYKKKGGGLKHKKHKSRKQKTRKHKSRRHKRR